MTTFSSTINILTVENEERTSKRTGNKYQHFVARAILLDDAGKVVTVGALPVRNEALRSQVKPGVYRAGFSLQVPDYGDDKGDICAVLTSLTPVPATPAPAPSK